MQKSLGSIKGFCRLTAIHLIAAGQGKRTGMKKWKFVCHNWTFLFPVRGMQLPQMMQWVNLKSGTFEKYWKSWSQSLWMCLVCVLPWRRKKLILLKAQYLHFWKVPAVHPDLIGQDLSASECSWLGTSAALAQAHTVFQYHGDTASNAALHWHHSWGGWNVYQLSRSKVCRHWVEQQYATKLTVVLPWCNPAIGVSLKGKSFG